MLADEMTMLKGVMVKIDDDHAVLVTLQHHSEPGENGKKFASEKSQKRWLARVDTIDSFKQMVKDLSDPSRSLKRCAWPDDPLPYHICFGNDSSNLKLADFIDIKLKKLKTWDEGLEIFKGWQTKTKHREAKYNPNATYDTDEYVDKAGAKVSLVDKQALLKHSGQNLWKRFSKKSKTPLPPPAPVDHPNKNSASSTTVDA